MWGSTRTCGRDHASVLPCVELPSMDCNVAAAVGGFIDLGCYPGSANTANAGKLGTPLSVLENKPVE